MKVVSLNVNSLRARDARVRAYLDADRSGVNLDGLGFSAGQLAKLRRIHLVACGTSWHSCLTAKFILEWLTGLPAEVDYASEYRYREPLLGDDLLVVGVTQSGETADTLAAMELAASGGALLATVCNVRGSSSWRLATSRMLTQAGPEIGVASTKAFTTQLVSLQLLLLEIGRLHGMEEALYEQCVEDLHHLPELLNQALSLDDAIRDLATRFVPHDHALFLGRGSHYPIAMEGALKLKEISYIHAEAYPAGELKHGPLALVDADMPILLLFVLEKMGKL